MEWVCGMGYEKKNKSLEEVFGIHTLWSYYWLYTQSSFPSAVDSREVLKQCSSLMTSFGLGSLLLPT
jgi:hypothetical protein